MREETTKLKTSTKALAIMLVCIVAGFAFGLLGVPEMTGLAGIAGGIFGFVGVFALLYEAWESRPRK